MAGTADLKGLDPVQGAAGKRVGIAWASVARGEYLREQCERGRWGYIPQGLVRRASHLRVRVE